MLESVDVPHVIEAVQAAALAAGTKELAGAAAGAATAAVKSTVDAGKKVLAWLKGKLTGESAKALDKACEKPDMPGAWHILQGQLLNLLDEEPAFRRELAAFLKEVMPDAVCDNTTQTANVSHVTGKVNIAQIKGSGNQVSQQ